MDAARCDACDALLLLSYKNAITPKSSLKALPVSKPPNFIVGSAFQIDPRCRRDLCWNLIGAVSSRVRILGQAAKSIGLSASFWFRVCHPSTLRIVI